MTAQLLPLIPVFLLLNLVAGMWRIHKGPSAADRMLAALLFGTTTVAVILTLAEAMDQPSLRDVALLFVLLATIISLAFFRVRGEHGEE
ncbi:MAG: monovalent cation/H+ antiporter complex subunit F [Wenzhouxiangellaceae bacterium]|nr:monovalent cation/H+ antiporter complex subunit F [Wenzhouxiangellaceae bacterium]